MSINYQLVPNRLTGESNLYAAQVKSKGTIDLSGLARAIAGSGSTTAESDILAVLTDAGRVMETFLLEGHRVDFGGLVSIGARIKGRFEGIEAGYDTERHRVDLSARVGSRLRSRFQTEAKVSRVQTITPAPSPTVLIDRATGTTNETLTLGRTAILRGRLLSFNADTLDEGLTVTAVADGTATRIGGIVINSPSQLVFEVPADLPPGDYTLDVRARINGTNQIRTGRLNATLTAAPAI